MPFHPSVVHLPVIVSLILPIVIGFFIYLLAKKKVQKVIWILIIFLNALVVGGGYVSLESGEIEEERVEKVVSKKLIHDHEEAAEVFVGVSVVALCLSVLSFFIGEKYQHKFLILTLIASIFSAGLGINVGSLGGDLVYKHGAGKAFLPDLNSGD